MNKKSKFYKLAPFITSLTIFTGGIGLMTGGAIAGSKERNELKNYYHSSQVQDYKQEQINFYEQKLTLGEITQKEFDDKIDYFDTDEFLKDATKVVFASDEEYKCIVKSIDNYNTMLYAGAGVAIGGYFVYLAFCERGSRLDYLDDQTEQQIIAGDDSNKEKQVEEDNKEKEN